MCSFVQSTDNSCDALDNDSTPLQSPNASYPYQQQGNYFPPLPDQPQGNGKTDVEETTNVTPTTSTPTNGTAAYNGTDEASKAEAQGSTTPTLAELPSSEASAQDGGLSIEDKMVTATPPGRRASFKDSKSNSILGVPPSNNARGGSLDIPRPNLQLGDISTDDNSAVDDGDDGTPPAVASPSEAASTPAQTTTQSKKSAWNLSWLKKQ